MKLTIKNLTITFILIFILRYIVLQFFPNLIINGYFSIFLCFFSIAFIFTNSNLFSIIIGLLVVNMRIIYRKFKDKKTLNNYNSLSNCFIFFVALLLLTIILSFFEKIEKNYSKYYSSIILILILINLYFLNTHHIDSNLLCFY